MVPAKSAIEFDRETRNARVKPACKLLSEPKNPLVLFASRTEEKNARRFRVTSFNSFKHTCWPEPITSRRANWIFGFTIHLFFKFVD